MPLTPLDRANQEHPPSGQGHAKSWLGYPSPVARFTLLIYRVLTALLVPVAMVLLTVRDRLSGKRRPSWSDRLVRSAPSVDPNGLWIQAVSVGEVEVARRILSELPGPPDSLPVTLTATTATGLALARKTLGNRVTVAPCPLDLKSPVCRFFDAVQPRALVLIETELWPEMLHQAKGRGVPIAIVNARLSDASFRRYRRFRWLLRPLLAPLTLVLARDESDARRFEALGVPPERVHVGGNVKYDLERDDTPLAWADDLPSMSAGRTIVVAGSTMDGEEALVLDALELLATQGPRPFLILAPRHPERCDSVARLLADRGLETMRRSQWTPGDTGSCEVFLIDTIGELARAYGLATVAFIGGSLVQTGGHNPLEPAVWGVPVLTGPHVANFEEVYRELVAAGGARVVTDAGQLAAEITTLAGDETTRRQVGDVGRSVVDNNRGATARICKLLMSSC